jgi:hypothetical protein
MAPFLANAEQTDLSGSGTIIVLIALGVVAAVAVLALVPIVLGRQRERSGGPRATGIIVGALLWALVTGATVTLWAASAYSWKQEQTRRLMTGYGDPHDVSGAPSRPILLWAFLAGGYVALIVFTQVRKPAQRG